MTYFLLGASAGLGRALARRLAAAGHHLILVSSDERDVAAMAADLSVRHGTRTVAIAADVGDGDAYLERVAEAAQALGGLDGVLCPIGVVGDRDDSRLTAWRAAWLTRVNFLSVVGAVTRFLPALHSRRRVVIVGFGSVAAARGRRTNVVYAAAKRALQSFFESLRHACVGSNIIVQFYVLGYLDTNLAFGRRILLPKGDPDTLSARVLRDLGRNIGVAYYPAFWRPLCAALRHAPWFLVKRCAFADEP